LGAFKNHQIDTCRVIKSLIYCMTMTIIKAPAMILTHFLAVRLGNTLELVLLADGVAVAGSLGSVDDLVSQALSDALHVTEGSLTGTSGDEGDAQVDATQGRHIDSLATHGTGISDTGGVFTGTSVDNSIDDGLDGVGISEQVDDLHGLLHDADGEELLAVVAAAHHEAVGHALNDGALGLAETLGSETAGRVGQEDATTELDIVLLNVGLDRFHGILGDTSREMSLHLTPSKDHLPYSLMLDSSTSLEKATGRVEAIWVKWLVSGGMDMEEDDGWTGEEADDLPILKLTKRANDRGVDYF